MRTFDQQSRHLQITVTKNQQQQQWPGHCEHGVQSAAGIHLSSHYKFAEHMSVSLK